MTKTDLDEYQIQAILDKFQPRPSNRLYQRMQRAPWTSEKQMNISFSRHLKDLFRVPQFRFILLAALILIVTFFGLVSYPSIGVVAQNFMRFLRPAASDHIAIPIRLPLSEEANSFGAPGYFSLTMEQAQEKVNFQLKIIDHPKTELSFSGAHFNPNIGAIIQRYSNPTYAIYFSQRRLGGVEEYTKIGGSAPVETAYIHGIEAEFATGGWRLDPTSEKLATTSSPGTQITVEAYWDENLPQSILRWQENGYLFEIFVVGKENQIKDELIQIAESVK